MSQDPRGRRLSKGEKEAILNDIRSRSLSFQSISKKHRVSISTVSRLAAENGLASPRKRTPAVEKPEHSYDREQRKSVLDRMLHSIDRMVERGGLSSRQLKDLASAAKEIAASRRSEDTIPEGSASALEASKVDNELDFQKLLLEMPEKDRRHVDHNGVFWDPTWHDEGEASAEDAVGEASGLGTDLKTRQGRQAYREFVALDAELEAEAEGEASEGKSGMTDGS
jgi:hypothetical protein